MAAAVAVLVSACNSLSAGGTSSIESESTSGAAGPEASPDRPGSPTSEVEFWTVAGTRLRPVDDAAFRSAFESDDDAVRWAAYGALDRHLISGLMGGRSASALLAELIDRETDTQLQALLVESTYDLEYVDGSLRATLLRLVEDPRAVVSLAALDALLEHGGAFHDVAFDRAMHFSPHTPLGRRPATAFLREARRSDLVRIEGLAVLGDERVMDLARRIADEYVANDGWTGSRAAARIDEQRRVRGRRHLQGPGMWEVSDADTLAASLAGARLAFFGELHTADPSLRERQKEALTSFAQGDGRLFLGVEPSVRRTQQSVIEYATRLGFEIVEVEEEWEANIAASRFLARDLECAAIVARILEKPGDPRLFVLRGESHLAPGGALLDGLIERPVVVLSGISVLPCWEDYPKSDIEGVVFRCTEQDDLFLIDCYEQSVPDQSAAKAE